MKNVKGMSFHDPSPCICSICMLHFSLFSTAAAEKRRKKAKQNDIIRELGVRVGLGRKSRGSQEKGNLAG